ncbi:hypothetical protein [Nocardia fluminea]|uniref:hypothetical protein n=1 Tax=Nocardia fluminea TaxID=134984 RepID=UPI00364EA85F
MKAIGVVRRTVSADPRLDESTIRTLAAKRGYDLRGILTIHADTYMPTALTVVTAIEQRAVAVLVPALKHLGGTEKEKAVALACDVVTPRETVRRTSDAGRG